MRSLSNNYVPIERTFVELKGSSAHEADSELLYLTARKKPLSWSEVLDEHRVILLSEAGSGKTTEIFNKAQQMRAAGKCAFFVRIEYISEDMDIAFEVGTHEEFLVWVGSGQKGWLFLDSIDEARLRHPRDFERAIKKMSLKLKPALQRVHITLTARTSAWKVKTDLQLCQEAFPYTPPANQAGESEGETPAQARSTSKPADQEVPAFRFVAIEDLSEQQVAEFARVRGVADHQKFLDQVDQMDAWFLTVRPLDLEELIDYWEANHRIGTRYELMVNSVERRLMEHDQDRLVGNPVSPAMLFNGAKLVAAAATLCHEPKIQTADGAYNDQGIPLERVLPQWSTSDRQTLLERPIFDEAHYGTVRFHHRSVREYLTARWLHDLLTNDGSRRQIEELFFRKQYGMDVVVPLMRPVLAWLAILDAPILERVCRIAPEVIFEGGDPSHLPVDTRSKILRQACEQLKEPGQGRSLISFDSAKRFASPELAAEINALLAKFSDNEDITWLLLLMVWHGQVLGALEQTKRFALTSRSKYSRMAAFKALKAIGSAQDRLEIRSAILQEDEEPDRDWIAELLEWLEPTDESCTWLIAAIKRVAPKRKYNVDSLTQGLSGLVAEWPVSMLNRLIREFGVLMDTPPVKEVYPGTLSKRFGWLTTPVSTILLALIRNRDLSAIESVPLSLLRKLPMLRDAGELDEKDLTADLRSEISKWGELNQNLFWYGVERSRDYMCSKGYFKHGLTLHNQVDVSGHLWSFSEADFEVACEWILSKESLDNRKVALSLAFSLYRDSEPTADKLEQMTKACAEQEDLATMLGFLLNPPPDDPKWRAQEKKWALKAARHKAVREGRKRQWSEGLQQDVDLLRSPPEPGQITNQQLYLLQRLPEVSNNSGNWSARNWEDLIPEFGESVASAFRDGAIKHWKEHTPQLRSEGAAANSTLYTVILGLVGISFEARSNPDWLRGLSYARAALATRYALHELNGFPGWLPSIYNAHPDAVISTLLGEIDFELASKPLAENSHYVLYDISWNGQWIWDGLSRQLITRLKSPFKNVTRLRQIATILQGSALDDSVLAALVSRKAPSAKNLEVASVWFAMWVGVAPQKAIPALSKKLSSTSEGDRARFAMLFITALMGSRRQHRTGRGAFRTVEHLKTLYLLMNTYIHEQDDIDRANTGVYSPELRDDAQDARNSLLTFIRETPGKDAFLALMELSVSHPNSKSRPWLASHAKEKATLDADMPPWSPQDVRDFNDHQERTPRTHRDLWELVVSQLKDLKHDLEDGDSSIASILKPMSQETEIRKFIGGWCRDRAKGRYSIPQEEEFADAKRADLRFHCAAFDGQIPTELKLADKWTGPKLEERLENQLCGDYMRDARSRYGIFLLVYHGIKPGRGWQMSDGKLARSFNELVAKLQKRWEQLAPTYPNIEDVLVIGIDLTKRTEG
ncbi:hypothetical protein ACIQSO_06555 [Pseudomonas putida]|uniref:hypothetical protein n=1 Tax=Pseudomonas putida TaxID=303 RepID=UPI00383A1762